MIAHITETCAECGAQNRWWLSKLGYNSLAFINWIKTGLCPRCHDPKERDNV